MQIRNGVYTDELGEEATVACSDSLCGSGKRSSINEKNKNVDKPDHLPGDCSDRCANMHKNCAA